MRDRPTQKVRPVVVRTPDHRLRVFVSSTLKELADEREAVRQAILKLRLAPVMFESGARPHPAQGVYQAYLSQSHVFVGIYWQSYGWIAPGMQISGLEDEYNLSRSVPALIYIKDPAPGREPALARMLERIRDENAGCYKTFRTADELRELVENDLALLLTEHFETARGEGQPPEVLAQTSLTNLPIPRNSLIGREKELEAARDLFLRENAALVTLTGPGGVGKSRLAIQAALELRDHFPDGVFMVGLESIRDADLVIPTIAKTLDITERSGGPPLADLLAAQLAEKRMLLLLDNFEQVLPAAPHIAQLLEACPHVRILTTSRAPLRLRAERELPVPLLKVPLPEEAPDLQRLSQYSAVQLFIQRAQGVKPDFQVTNENAPAVAEICHRLDGLPLAIELASSRIRTLPPRVLLARLEHRFEVLRGGTRDLPERQHTLYGAIDWSYNLLDESEKSLFRRLSVFVGGWTYEAAATVCGAEDEQQPHLFDRLEALVDSSLLGPPDDVDGEPRFKMLETLRDFAHNCLTASGEADVTHRLHMLYYLSLAERIEATLRQSTPQQVWYRPLEVEVDNLRAAIAWALDRSEAELALRLCETLGRFWELRGYHKEGRYWVEQTLKHSSPAPMPLRVNALRLAGRLSYEQRDWAAAQAFYGEGLALSQQLNDQSGVASLLNNLGNVAWALSNLGRAGELYEQVLAIRREQNDQRGIAAVLNNLGLVSMKLGHFDRAAQYMEESAALNRVLGDQPGLANALFNLGLVTVRLEDGAGRAAQHLAGCVAIARGLGYRKLVAYALNNLAMLALHEGDEAQATAFAQESLELCLKLEDRLGAFYAFVNLGHAALDRGDARQAASLIGEALTLLRQLESSSGHPRPEELAWFLECAVHLATLQDQTGQAVQLAGSAAALREQADVHCPPSASAYYGSYLARARARLDDAESVIAWDAGRTMDAEQARAHAIEVVRANV